MMFPFFLLLVLVSRAYSFRCYHCYEFGEGASPFRNCFKGIPESTGDTPLHGRDCEHDTDTFANQCMMSMLYHRDTEEKFLITKDCVRREVWECIQGGKHPAVAHGDKCVVLQQNQDNPLENRCGFADTLVEHQELMMAGGPPPGNSVSHFPNGTSKGATARTAEERQEQELDKEWMVGLHIAYCWCDRPWCNGDKLSLGQYRVLGLEPDSAASLRGKGELLVMGVVMGVVLGML